MHNAPFTRGGSAIAPPAMGGDRHTRGAESGLAPSGSTVYGSMDRVQLTLPPGEYSAIPDLPDGLASFGGHGGGAVVTTSAVATDAVNDIGLSFLVPDLLAIVKKSGPVRAIAIAADSPLAACDLWLGDITVQNRFRISPGRPWIGDISSLDRVIVTLPRAIPNPWDGRDNAETVANFLLGSVFWGASGTVPTPAGPSPRVDTSWPLRLELYRGELLPLVFQQRSPLYADMWVSLDTAAAANPAFAQLYAATDGRKRTTVTVVNRNAAAVPCKVTVTGYKPTLAKRQVGQPQSVRRFGVPFVLDTVILPGDTTGIMDITYDTARYPMMRVRVEPPAGQTTAVASVHVISEDE